jgi:hypothetical protein
LGSKLAADNDEDAVVCDVLAAKNDQAFSDDCRQRRPRDIEAQFHGCCVSVRILAVGAHRADKRSLITRSSRAMALVILSIADLSCVEFD